MQDYFTRKKPLIARELGRLLVVRRSDLDRVNEWGSDTTERLSEFAVQGKMVRGGLVLLGYEMLARHAAGRPILQAAAALELVHSSLLIHDDIMDNDRLRRGLPTLFAQYEGLARTRAVSDAGPFGASLGICAGDIGFFLAWDILSRLSVAAERRTELLAMTSRELAYVGLAQMQDVALGASARLPSGAAVTDLYRYKTARYTFSLPLMGGALLAGAPAPLLRGLGRLGERLGVVFQIRDDELGIFGSEAQTGKPVGSDIREGKKTLLYLELLARAKGAEKRRLQGLLGKKGFSQADVDFVRQSMERLGARRHLNEMAEALEDEAVRMIGRLPISSKYRGILLGIAGQGMKRTR